MTYCDTKDQVAELLTKSLCIEIFFEAQGSARSVWSSKRKLIVLYTISLREGLLNGISLSQVS